MRIKPVNSKYEPPVIRRENILKVAEERGYRTVSDFYRDVEKWLFYEGDYRYFVTRKMAIGEFTFCDICLISDGLKMTPAEFISVWFPFLFNEDEDGNIVAHMDEYTHRRVKDRRHYHKWQSHTKGNGQRRITAMREAEKLMKELSTEPNNKEE